MIWIGSKKMKKSFFKLIGERDWQLIRLSWSRLLISKKGVSLIDPLLGNLIISQLANKYQSKKITNKKTKTNQKLWDWIRNTIPKIKTVRDIQPAICSALKVQTIGKVNSLLKTIRFRFNSKINSTLSTNKNNKSMQLLKIN